MSDSGAFFRKTGKKIAVIFGVSYVLYMLYSFYRMYSQSETIDKFLSKAWSYPLYQNPGNTVVITLGKLVILIGFLAIAFFVSQLIVRKIIHQVLEKTSLDRGAKSAIENLSIYLLTFVFIVIALSVAEIPLAALTFVGGALAIGIGFGTQNILNNFFSGIILQIEKPIKVGDIILVEDMRGTVEAIGARSTKLALSDNTHVIIPNSKLLENKVANWTLKDNIIRSKIDLELSYSDRPEEVMSDLLQVINSESDVLKFPEAKIYLTDMSSYSIKYTIYFWVRIESTYDKHKHESDIKIKILQLITQKGYNIALPTQAIQYTGKPPVDEKDES